MVIRGYSDARQTAASDCFLKTRMRRYYAEEDGDPAIVRSFAFSGESVVRWGFLAVGTACIGARRSKFED